MRSHVNESFWLRRRSVRRQRSDDVVPERMLMRRALVGTAWYAKYPVTTA